MEFNPSSTAAKGSEVRIDCDCVRLDRIWRLQSTFFPSGYLFMILTLRLCISCHHFSRLGPAHQVEPRLSSVLQKPCNCLKRLEGKKMHHIIFYSMTWYQIILYHIISLLNHITLLLNRIILYHIIWHYMTWHQIKSCCIISHSIVIMSYRTRSYRTRSYRISHHIPFDLLSMRSTTSLSHLFDS